MPKEQSGMWVRLSVVVTFVAMVAVNALANLLPINGIATGAVSDSYPNLFAPAGLTFSIWGLIYLLLGAHTLYQLGLFRSKERNDDNGLLGKTGIVFSVSSLINAVWIFSWHYQVIPLSMILMAGLLLCLIIINTAINRQCLSIKEKLLLRLPFSVYFGWITVATIANATTLLVSIGWNGFGLPESTWAVIMLAAGALIGAAAAIRFKDIAYGLVLVWAYAGILIKHTASSGFSNQYPDVIIAAIVCIVVFAGAILYALLAEKRKPVGQ